MKAHSKSEYKRLQVMKERKKEPAGDNAAFDVHSTDPARLEAEVKKDLGVIAPVMPLPPEKK